MGMMDRKTRKELRQLSIEEQADIKNPIIDRKSMWGYTDTVPHEASIIINQAS